MHNKLNVIKNYQLSLIIKYTLWYQKTNILQNDGTQIGYNEYLPVAFCFDSEWYVSH